MPSASKKQHNFMAAVAHSPEFAKKAGVPQSVGKDFVTADKGRKFSQGGRMAESKKAMEMRHARTLGKIAKEEAAEAKEYKSGGRLTSKGEHPVQTKSKRGAEIIKMAKGGLAAGHKSADGIAQRGKTRAMAVTMKRGGKC